MMIAGKATIPPIQFRLGLKVTVQPRIKGEGTMTDFKRGDFVIFTEEVRDVFGKKTGEKKIAGRVHSVQQEIVKDKLTGEEKLGKVTFVNVHYIDENLEFARCTVVPSAVILIPGTEPLVSLTAKRAVVRDEKGVLRDAKSGVQVPEGTENLEEVKPTPSFNPTPSTLSTPSTPSKPLPSSPTPVVKKP